MRNSWKVAKWEIKKNMTNKSFLISLLLTPAIFLLFFTIPMFFSSDDELEILTVIVNDELGIWEHDAPISNSADMDVVIDPVFENEERMIEALSNAENTVYISLTSDLFLTGEVPIYLSDDLDERTLFRFSSLEAPLRQVQLESFGLSGDEARLAARGVLLQPVSVGELSSPTDEAFTEAERGMSDPFERLVPGGFAGLILFSIVITGMMIFQSASQEKKEKVAEMVLSSITANDLMQGKIIGYFVLGIFQVTIWLVIALPIIEWRTDIPVFSYLFVPELLLLLLIAIAGYLLFASIFVSIGATVEEINTSSNFQGIIMMLPFIPFILFGPIFADPNGMVAKVGSFIPITSPGVLLIRLSILEEWPWIEILLAIVVLFISIWLFMKLAGKIFKTGILLYGKNATPQEIWKWIRH